MATKKLFRCLNPKCAAKSKGEFYAIQPTCPQCKIQAFNPHLPETDSNNPKFDRFIQRLVLIHFDPPTEVPGVGQNYRACDRKIPIQASTAGNGMPNPWHAGTGTAAAVTCPDCKASAEFRTAIESEEEDGPELAKAAMNRLQSIAGM